MDQHMQIAIAPSDVRIGRPRLASSWRRYRELRAARQAADAELLSSEFTAPRTAWRAAELTAPKNRLAVARSIHRLIRSADARYLPGATPLNRLEVREQSAALQALEDWLEDLGRPITARGVLMLDELLTDGYGPLYVPYRASELRWTLAGINRGLQTSS